MCTCKISRVNPKGNPTTKIAMTHVEADGGRKFPDFHCLELTQFFTGRCLTFRNKTLLNQIFHIFPHCTFIYITLITFASVQKAKKGLTSDVLHGDGAGSGEFSGHPEGFVAQLLVHQCAFKERICKNLVFYQASLRLLLGDCMNAFRPGSPPSFAVFSSKWTEYKEKMATAARRILQRDGER